VNYQYRVGASFPVALRTLYADGGIPRFYRGVLPALLQGPLSRFGDTAANTGMLTLLNNIETTKDLNVGLKTATASAAAALFRIFLMPIDTVKVRTYLPTYIGFGSTCTVLDLTKVSLFRYLYTNLFVDNHASDRKVLGSGRQGESGRGPCPV
jgi:hypothetical protein